MSAALVEKELDPTPVVAALMEKSATGKIPWEATANEDTFVSSVGGQTLRIELVRDPDDPEDAGRPVLYLLDAKGKTIWQIYSGQTKTGLWDLYALAQRVGNKVDDKVAALMEALQRL